MVAALALGALGLLVAAVMAAGQAGAGNRSALRERDGERP